MSVKSVINVDLADVWAERGRKNLVRTLTWGDEVAVLKQAASHLEIETVKFEKQDDGTVVIEEGRGVHRAREVIGHQSRRQSCGRATRTSCSR